MPEKVVFHLPRVGLHQSFTDRPHLKIFKKIQHLIQSRGGEIEIRARIGGQRDPSLRNWEDLIEPHNLHIIENGQVRQSNAINTTVSYIQPFFHFDQKGTLAHSSAAEAVFDNVSVDPEAAERFVKTLRNTLVVPRCSRYSPQKQYTDIPEGCIAVFLQGSFPHTYGTAFCDNETLLRTVLANANGRPVVVKAHPVKDSLKDAKLIYALMQEGLSVEATDANIHDILAKCAVTVSYNSAVSVEGFLHGKPAILFGKSDFHHVCETVTDPTQFPQKLDAALNSTHDYVRYLYWYFSEFCLSTKDPCFDQKILRQFENMGFDDKRLGLNSIQTPKWIDGLIDDSAAANAALAVLKTLPEVQSVKVRRVLKVSEASHVFLCSLNGQKVVVKRFFGEDPAHTVRSLKAELDYLEGIFGEGNCQANRCLMAWPDHGLVVLSHAPGVRLEEKIAGETDAARAKLMRQSGRWLAAYTGARQRQSTFAPKFWIQRAEQVDLGHITKPEDLELTDRLLAALRKLARRAKGKPVQHAATHGEFVGANLHYSKGVICGVDIQGECWTALAREVARFLVWQQLHDPLNTEDTRYGINRRDWRAFLTCGVVEEHEKWTTLPFFVAEQFFNRFVQDYHRSIVRDQGRIAIRNFLAEVELTGG